MRTLFPPLSRLYVDLLTIAVTRIFGSEYKSVKRSESVITAMLEQSKMKTEKALAGNKKLPGRQLGKQDVTY